MSREALTIIRTLQPTTLTASKSFADLRAQSSVRMPLLALSRSSQGPAAVRRNLSIPRKEDRSRRPINAERFAAD